MAQSCDDIIINFPNEQEQEIKDIEIKNSYITSNEFLKYCEDHKEYVIFDKIIETKCCKDNQKFKNKMHVLAYKLNYGNYIGYIIETEIPFNINDKKKIAYSHP